MILFLDPGVTTGYALFEPQGTVKDFGQIRGLDSFVEFLTMTHKETPLEKIWYEPYVLRNSATRNMNANQKKGHQDTLKIVGAIETFSKISNVPNEEIYYVQLNAALAQAGLKMPKDHAQSHQIVALAYGRSYFIINKIVKPRRRHSIE